MKVKLLFTIIIVLFIGLFSCYTVDSPPEKEDGVRKVLPESPGIDIPETVREPENTYESIGFSVLQGDAQKAIEKFENAFSEDPEDADQKVLYAALLIQGGKYQEAEQVLLSVLDENEGHIDAHFHLAIVYWAYGNLQKQLSYLQRVLELDSEHSDANAVLGEIFLEERNYHKAESHFKRALKSNSDNMTALIGYGNLLYRQERDEEAIEIFNRVIEQNPDYTFAYIDRAKAKAETGDIKGAEDDFTTALNQEPDYYWHYIDRGRFYLTQKRDQFSANIDFSKAIELDPDCFYAYAFRAGIRYADKDYDGAYGDYKLTLRLKPEYYFSYEKLGIIAFMKEEYEFSAAALKDAYEYDEGNHRLAFLRALALRHTGRHQEAKEYLEDIINPMDRNNGWYHIGRSIIEDGYDTRGYSVYKDQPAGMEKYQMLFYLGAYYELKGSRRTAESTYETIADLEMIGFFEKEIAEYRMKQWMQE